MAIKDSVTNLFVSSYNDLCRYIKRFVHSDETASDIAQEAFIKTLVNMDKLEIPRAFLFTVAKRMALDSCRHDRLVQFDRCDDFAEMLAANEPADELLIRLEQTEALRKAINLLPPRCKAVFSQRVFFGASYRQLAKKYHLSEKTVEHHIALGLREVHKTLKKAK